MTKLRNWFVALLLSTPMSLLSQVAAADIWVDQIVGVSYEGFIGGLQGNYATETSAYSLRFLYYDNTQCCADYGEVSVSYGFKSRQKYSITTYQAGLGLVQRRIVDGLDLEEDISLAIPFSASVVFGKYVGLGFHLNANVNRYQPMVGLGVGWSYGKFRN